MIAHSRAKPVMYAPSILALWRQGLNTHDIAKRIWLPEHVVANALARARDAERER